MALLRAYASHRFRCVLVLVCALCWASSSVRFVAGQAGQLSVDTSPQTARKMPDKMFTIFVEEINHAGAGGLWAELLSNRGFEAGGPNTPSNIDPCGHGFRKDLASTLANLKPQFLKFPGGNYAMGNYLRNAFHWGEIVGPWEERPGHVNGAWGYWTDDGLGFYEFLQLVEDLGASPVWVVNAGASINEEVPTAIIASLVKILYWERFNCFNRLKCKHISSLPMFTCIVDVELATEDCTIKSPELPLGLASGLSCCVFHDMLKWM